MLLATHADQLSKDLIAPSLDDVLVRALCLPIKEPLGGELGHRRGDMGVEDVVPVAAQIQEPVVAPDDLPVFRSEDDHGEGGVGHGVLAGLGDVPAEGVDETVYFLFSGTAGEQVVDQQERRDENFDGGQKGGEVDCDGGEEDEDAEKQLGLGFWQPV